jgi:branched-chain amino acid transport system substrate-binding protein
LEQHDWTAGTKTVGYYSCDDADPAVGTWNRESCEANATDYADAPTLVGVIGTWNSGCSRAELPILNGAAGGGIALVSSSASLPCLTRKATGCLRHEPSQYAESGRRSFARVVPTETMEGAGLALFAKRQGVHRVFILHDGQRNEPAPFPEIEGPWTIPWGRMVGRGFRGAAHPLGIKVVGYRSWAAPSYTKLMRQVARQRPDAILLAGDCYLDGGEVIRAKVSVLGPNRGPVKLLASDSFNFMPYGDAGASAEGMFISSQILGFNRLPARGRQFVADFRTRFGFQKVNRYVPYTAQVAEMYLEAIANSDGSRSGVLDALFSMNVEHGLIGSFSIDARGDATSIPVTIRRMHAKKLNHLEVVRPGQRLVNAAYTRY